MSSIRSKAQIITEGLTGRLEVPDYDKKPLNADVLDHVFFNCRTSEQIAALGEKKHAFFKAITEASQEDQIGGKHILIVPTSEEKTLPTFTRGWENPKSARLRHGLPREILLGTEAVLKSHSDLIPELKQNFEFHVGTEGLDYQILHELIDRNAGFLPDAMARLGEEGAGGKFARFNQTNVITFSLRNKDNGSLVGVVRAYQVAPSIVYLADETVLPTILSEEKFSGVTKDEQQKNRWQFIFAYFMNLVCQDKSLNDIQHLTIIAAAPRVPVYEKIGFSKLHSETFGKDMVALTRFEYPKPGNQLFEAKKILITRGENALATHIAKMKRSEEAKTSLFGDLPKIPIHLQTIGSGEVEKKKSEISTYAPSIVSGFSSSV